MRALVLTVLALGVVGVVLAANASPATPGPALPELPPPEKKGYGLGPACGQLTIYDAATALAWAYDQGLAAKTKVDAFVRISEGCPEASLYALIKAPTTAGFMFLLGRSTLKGLVAGGGLGKADAQLLLDGWRKMALSAGVAGELLPEDV